MTPTRELSGELYRLASEMRREEGCTTMDPAIVEAAAMRLDEQTVQINELQRRSRAHHGVPSQPLQSGTVGGPMGPPIGWYTPVVVEVYAIGSGVTLPGERSDLAGREGTLELEANGQLFVFDPLAARVTERLISAVEGNITAVGQTIEAVDEAKRSEVGFQGHVGIPPKTAILSLPQGYGKTTMAHALARWLGCTCVFDEWHPGLELQQGALHLTNAQLHAVEVPA